MCKFAGANKYVSGYELSRHRASGGGAKRIYWMVPL